MPFIYIFFQTRYLLLRYLFPVTSYEVFDPIKITIYYLNYYFINLAFLKLQEKITQLAAPHVSEENTQTFHLIYNLKWGKTMYIHFYHIHVYDEG